MLAVVLALLSAALFGAMTVALRFGFREGRPPDAELGARGLPLVATESLWGVTLSVLLFKRSELVGVRLVSAAILVVAGGILISVFR